MFVYEENQKGGSAGVFGLLSLSRKGYGKKFRLFSAFGLAKRRISSSLNEDIYSSMLRCLYI